jgi:hypothetical protein
MSKDIFLAFFVMLTPKSLATYQSKVLSNHAHSTLWPIIAMVYDWYAITIGSDGGIV